MRRLVHGETAMGGGGAVGTPNAVSAPTDCCRATALQAFPLVLQSLMAFRLNHLFCQVYCKSVLHVGLMCSCGLRCCRYGCAFPRWRYSIRFARSISKPVVACYHEGCISSLHLRTSAAETSCPGQVLQGTLSANTGLRCNPMLIMHPLLQDRWHAMGHRPPSGAHKLPHERQSLVGLEGLWKTKRPDDVASNRPSRIHRH